MSKFVLTAQLQLQAPTNVGQVVNQIQSQLNNVKVNVQAQGTAQATSQINKVTQATQQASNAATQLGKNFGLSIKRFAAFSIATRAVSLFTSSISKAIKEAIAFERELIKISQVTGKSISQLRDLTNEITKLSTSLGVSSTSLLSTSRILSQAGLDARETKVALDALAKSDLAPTFDDIGQTAEGVVAIFNQFQAGVEALEAQLGAINAVAGQFAVEAGDLISVIRRTGGVFKAAGGDLNELIALFTSVRSTTRESAESIATGLRTIFTRIQRPKTIEYLRQFGVELLDLEGKFVGPFEATRRLSEALSGLEQGDITFVQIAEELGGFRQIGKVIPLLQQFSVAQEAYAVAQGGANSLSEDAAKAQAALAVRITKVKEEFLALVRSISESTSFQLFANTALNLASALIKLADALKPIIPLLITFASIKLATGFGGFLKGVSGGLKSPRGFARGGMVPGSGNRDTVPAMLTPGEFVIRKSSVAKLGAQNLAAMNENKYAKGGIIALRPYDDDPAETVKKQTGTISRESVATKAGLPAGKGKSYVERFRSIANMSKNRDLIELATKGSLKVDAYGASLGDKNVGDATEKNIKKGFAETINNGATNLATKLKTSKQKSISENDLELFGINSVIGNAFEAMLVTLGAPFDAPGQDEIQKAISKANNNSAFDYPGGLGSIATSMSRLSELANIPVDAKRTLTPRTLKNLIDVKYVNLLADSFKENYVKFQGMEQVTALKGVKPGQEFSGIGALAKFGIKNQQQALDAGFTSPARGYWRAPGRHFGGFIQKFATGGAATGTDTVPAMLTPGEFVINRASAQKIGYGSLNRMNKVGKYASGGVVQHFAAGSGATGVTPSGPTQTQTLKESLTSSSKAINTVSAASPELAQAIKQYATTSKTGSKKIMDLSKQVDEKINSMRKSKKSEEQIKAQLDKYTTQLQSATTTLQREEKTRELARKGLEKNGQMHQIMQTGNKDVKQAGVAAMKGQMTGAQLGAAMSSGQLSKSQANFIIETNKAAAAANQAAAASKNAAAGDNMDAASSKAAAQADAAEAAASNKSAMAGMGAGMGIMMAAGAVQSLLPPLDETSGAMTKLMHGSLTLAMTIGGLSMALTSLAPGLTAAGVASFFFGGAGTAAAAQTTAFGASLLISAGSANTASASLARLAGNALIASQSLITNLVNAAGPILLAVAAFFAIEMAGKALVDSFGQYDKKIKKAQESGDVGNAGKYAYEQAQAHTTVTAAAGLVVVGLIALAATLGFIGAPFALLIAAVVAAVAAFRFLTSESPAYAKAQAESIAQQVNVQNALKQATKDATIAMEDFEKGNITAAQAVAATAESGKEIEKLQKINAAADVAANDPSNALARWWNPDKFEKDQKERDQKLKDARQEFIKTNQPAVNALARQTAAGGGDFSSFLASIKQENEALFKALTAEGTSDLKKAFENIAKETEKTRKAIEAMSLGFDNISTVSGALSTSMSNYLNSQEAGYSALENTIATLEAGITSAAAGLSGGDWKDAVDSAKDGLRQLGGNESDITKFEENINAINSAQRGFAKATEEAKQKFMEDVNRGAGGPGGATRETVAAAVGNQLDMQGVAPEVKQRIVDALEGAEMSPEDLRELSQGNMSVLNKILGKLGEETLNQVLGPLKELAKYEQQLAKLTQNRLEMEDKVISAQKNMVEAQMEAAEIIAKYGGPAFTPDMKAQGIIAQSNIEGQAAGVSPMMTGSAAELNRRNAQIRTGLSDIANVRAQAAAGNKDAQKQLSGQSGVNLAAQEKRLQDLAKSEYDTTKRLISLKEEELKLISEKNRLEKSSIEALVTGDINKFFEQQAAVGARASIALGSDRLQGAYGADALGAAAQDIQRLQEAGVQTLYGQQISGTGGLAERGYAAALSARGVGSGAALNMASTAAGTTPEEEALKGEIRSLASTLPNYAAIQLQTAQQDLAVADIQMQAAEKQLEAAKANAQARGVKINQMARGGVVYANRGIFVPKGTDTVPAMLTPGEFVVRREAVRRGNNLQLLQSMNRGQSGVSTNGAVAMADGGVVYARRGIFVNRNSGVQQTNQTGIGLSPDLVNKLATSLNSFNSTLSANIDRLNNTSFNVKLDTTNVNVNLNGGSFLSKLKDDLKNELLVEIGNQIKNYSVGQDGRLKSNPGTLT